MDTALDLEKLEAQLHAATPGPWDGCFAPNCFVLGEQANLKFSPLSWPVAFLPKVNGYPKPDNGLVASVCSEEDRKFIAALRNAAPELIKMARRTKSAEQDWANREADVMRLRVQLEDAERELSAANDRVAELARELRECEINKAELWKVARADADRMRQLKADGEDVVQMLITRDKEAESALEAEKEACAVRIEEFRDKLASRPCEARDALSRAARLLRGLPPHGEDFRLAAPLLSRPA